MVVCVVVRGGGTVGVRWCCSALCHPCSVSSPHAAAAAVACLLPQPGRYGKITSRLFFPEHLDLGPYMATERCLDRGGTQYTLYAVVVHLDWGRSTDSGALALHCAGDGVGWGGLWSVFRWVSIREYVIVERAAIGWGGVSCPSFCALVKLPPRPRPHPRSRRPLHCVREERGCLVPV